METFSEFCDKHQVTKLERKALIHKLALYRSTKTLALEDDQKPEAKGSAELALLGAMAFYLANDGSHGIFDAMKLAEAKKQVVALIGEPAIKAKQHSPF